MKKLSALLFALLTAAVPCAALAADAPVYSPSPCEPVVAPVCGPVRESAATESTAGTACPGGVCQINVDVSNSCPGGVCAVASNGPPVAKQVRAWSRTRVVERSDRRSSVRSVAAFDACAVRKRGAFANRRVAATVVVRSNACAGNACPTGTCATATAAPPLPCAPVCR